MLNTMKKSLIAFLLMFTFMSSTVAQINWEHTLGPEGGGGSYLCYNQNYCFFADAFHLYRTVDGTQWERIELGQTRALTTSGSKLVAWKGYGNLALITSYDNGNTWQEVPALPGLYNWEIAATSENTYVLGYSNQSDFIFYTSDDGLTWDTLLMPLPYTPYQTHIITFENQLYYLSPSVIWKLAPDGVNWTVVSPVLANDEKALTMYVEGPNILIGTNQAIWASNDNGQNWTITNTGDHLSQNNFAKVNGILYKDGDPANALLASNDMGQSWSPIPLSANLSFYRLSIAGSRLLAKEFLKGMYYFDPNSATFLPANNGLFSGNVSEFEIYNGKLWAASGNGIVKYDLTTRTWDNSSNLPLSFNNIQTGHFKISPSGVFMAYSSAPLDSMYISFDQGQTWQARTAPNYHSIMTFNGEILVNDNYYYSSDYGLTWTYTGVKPPLRIEYFNGFYYGITELEIQRSLSPSGPWEVVSNAPYDPRELYCSGDRLFVYGQKNSGLPSLYTSTDGSTWTYAHNGLSSQYLVIGNPFPQEVTGNVWKHDNRYYLYDFSLGGMFISLDTCQTWQSILQGYFNDMVLVDTTFYVGNHSNGVATFGPPQNFGVISKGRVFADENGNGSFDPNESTISNALVGLYDPSNVYPFWSVRTLSTGEYTLGGLLGTPDTIRLLFSNPYIDTIIPPYYVANSPGSGYDFAVRFQENITDGRAQHNLWSVPRPGFSVNVDIIPTNVGTTELNGTLGVKLDPQFTYISASPSPDAILGDSLVWNLSNISIMDTRSIILEGVVSAQAQVGTSLKIASTIHPIGTDATPADNYFVSTDTIRGSYDPNDKTVVPAHGLTPSEIAEGKSLTYTIRFQNTGTYLAEKVRITDQLDPALNWQTLQLVDASHPITNMRLLPGGMLDIVFDQINLPDSISDEPGSHGYVCFAIQQNKTYDLNYAIKNKALIFFDFNDPIITNTVTSKVILDPSGLEDPAHPVPGKKLSISPNPAQESCTVSTQSILRGMGELIVTDAKGNICLRQKVLHLEQPMTLLLGQLAEGIYTVQVTGEAKVMTGKIVIARH